MKEQKHDVTYKTGNTTIHVVSPRMTKEEQERVLDDFHQAGWVIVEKLAQKRKDSDRNDS